MQCADVGSWSRSEDKEARGRSRAGIRPTAASLASTRPNAKPPIRRYLNENVSSILYSNRHVTSSAKIPILLL